jgi:hypothetical protein
MGIYNEAGALRAAVLGAYVQGQTSTITADATYQLFTVAGGEVLVTALWGKVTTAISDGGEDLNIVMDPTTGDSVQLTQDNDLGTTDTAAGTVLAFAYDQDGATNTPMCTKGAGEPLSFVATTGEIELLVTAGTGSEDGVVEWYCTYVALTPGATVTAATT